VADLSSTAADSPRPNAPLARVDRTGVNAESATLALQPLFDTAVVQVFARKADQGTVAAKLGDEPGLARVTNDYTAMPIAPGQWIVTANHGGDGSFLTSLQQQLGDVVHLSEQSHGRVIIRVTGEGAREVMQKGCRLDLHPTQATTGFCAQTSMAQVGVLMHQVDNSPTYDLHVYSGFALSFWHWLTESSAQYGYKVVI